jgi:hypothetical protein
VTNGKREPTIKTLIERSSLGSADARAARARVPIATGRAVARSSVTGKFVQKNTRRK